MLQAKKPRLTTTNVIKYNKLHFCIVESNDLSFMIPTKLSLYVSINNIKLDSKTLNYMNKII